MGEGSNDQVLSTDLYPIRANEPAREGIVPERVWTNRRRHGRGEGGGARGTAPSRDGDRTHRSDSADWERTSRFRRLSLLRRVDPAGRLSPRPRNLERFDRLGRVRDGRHAAMPGTAATDAGFPRAAAGRRDLRPGDIARRGC